MVKHLLAFIILVVLFIGVPCGTHAAVELDVDANGAVDINKGGTNATDGSFDSALSIGGTGDSWLEMENNTSLVDDITGAYGIRFSSGVLQQIINGTPSAISSRFQSLAVADLSDATTPSVLTIAETTNKAISNYKATGADHVFTMPAAHINGNVIFLIGDEFQVDIEPDSGANFFLNGTAMAADEHIQNTADTLGEQMVGFVANINGTLTWMFESKYTNFVEETP